MTIGAEILASVAVNASLVGVLAFFCARWFGRVEAKIDMIPGLITRQECSLSLNRVHGRIDEHIAEEAELATRLARLEAREDV